LQETRQEQEARWAAQRASRDSQEQTYRTNRARTRGRNWLVIGGIVIILAVIAAITLF